MFGTVADGKNVRLTGLQVAIYEDTATQFDPGILQESNIRGYAWGITGDGLPFVGHHCPGTTLAVIKNFHQVSFQPEVDMVFPDVFVDHPGLAFRQYPVPEICFPDQEGYRDIPAAQHFGQFYSNQPSPDDNSPFTYLLIRGIGFQQIEVLFGIQPLYAVQVLPRPAKLTGLRAGGDNEFIIGKNPGVTYRELFFLGVHLGHIRANQLNPVFSPKIVLIGLYMLKFHMPHVDVHQGGTGKEVIAFCGNNGNPIV